MDFLLKQIKSNDKKPRKMPMGFKLHVERNNTLWRYRLLDSFFSLVAVSPYKYKKYKEAELAGKAKRDEAKAQNR